MVKILCQGKSKEFHKVLHKRTLTVLGAIQIHSILLVVSPAFELKTMTMAIVLFMQLQNCRTPLYWASLSGHRAVVELLLKNGADVYITSEVTEITLTQCWFMYRSVCMFMIVHLSSHSCQTGIFLGCSH